MQLMQGRTVGITGPREITSQQAELVLEVLTEMNVSEWFVGDASGVDALVAGIARKIGALHFYEKRSDLPFRARGAERSTRMVKALKAANGVLLAFPNKPASPLMKPAKSWPKNTGGSGTWGTIALATGLNIPVEIYPLAEMDLPDWLGEAEPCK